MNGPPACASWYVPSLDDVPFASAIWRYPNVNPARLPDDPALYVDTGVGRLPIVRMVAQSDMAFPPGRIAIGDPQDMRALRYLATRLPEPPIYPNVYEVVVRHPGLGDSPAAVVITEDFRRVPTRWEPATAEGSSEPLRILVDTAALVVCHEHDEAVWRRRGSYDPAFDGSLGDVRSILTRRDGAFPVWLGYDDEGMLLAIVIELYPRAGASATGSP